MRGHRTPTIISKWEWRRRNKEQQSAVSTQQSASVLSCRMELPAALLRFSKAEKVAAQELGLGIVGGKRPGPWLAVAIYQASGGRVRDPVIAGLLANRHAERAGWCGFRQLPFKKRSLQALTESLGRKQAEDPIMPRQVESRARGGENPRAIFAGHGGGAILRGIIENQQLIAGTQRLQCSPKAQCIIVRVDECRKPGHGKRDGSTPPSCCFRRSP